MSVLKTTTIIVAIIAIFASCKKENNITKNNEPKDYSSVHLKMNYYGQALEYTVKYSPSTRTTKTEGKDASRVLQVLEQAPNGVVFFESENQIIFFNNKIDFYDYTKKESLKNNSRLEAQAQNQFVQNATVKFYRNVNFVDQMDIRTVDQFTAAQNFVLYYHCGSNLNDNWCTNGVPNYASGFKVASVPNGTNDNLSSFTIESPQTYDKDFWLILHQDGNFGGRHIAFKLPAYQQQFSIASLTNWKKIAWVNGSWNDSVSSYEGYYYAY
jgi:hypothetical protein